MRYLVLLLPLLLAACSTVADGAYEQLSGRYFDSRNIDKIVDGQTTKDEILQWFGLPILVGAENDEGMLRYQSVRRRESVERSVFTERVHSTTVEKTLTVHLRQGIVVSHNASRKITYTDPDGTSKQIKD